MEQRTFLTVPFEFVLDCVETQTELAYIQAVDVVIEGWVGAVVPGSTAVLAQLDTVDGFDLGDLLMGD